MTAARCAAPSQPPRAPQGASRPQSPHRRAARARTALAVATGGLAGVALGMCCGIRSVAVDAAAGGSGSRSGPGDGPVFEMPRQPPASVALVLAPAMAAQVVAARQDGDVSP